MKTLDLTNTQNITDFSQMTPYTTAVTNFIDHHRLPSYSYPEVYERMVVQLDLPIELNPAFPMVFLLGDDFEYCSIEDFNLLAAEIRELDDDKELFFQLRNA